MWKLPNKSLERTVNRRGRACARWQLVRGPVRSCGCGRPFNGIVRRHLVMRAAPLLLLVPMLLLSSARAGEASPKFRDVVDAREVQRHTRDFEKSLATLGILGRLRCSMVIELVESTPDYSYGGICDLTVGRERRTIMVCDDTMVGKFTLKVSGFAIDRGELASFTRANCPGGG